MNKKTLGRPRTFDRGEAVRVAEELFWRHGYEGTSLAQLTDAMGITPPSFYAAFGSKEDLFREAVGVYLSTHANFVTRALQQEESARAAVERMLNDAASAFSQPGLPPGCMVGSGALQSASANATIAEAMTGIRRHTRALVQTRLEQAVASGELPASVDAPALAAYFSAVVQGLSVQAIDGAPSSLLKQIAELAMAALPRQ